MLALILCTVAASCASPPGVQDMRAAEGPARVQPDVVERHAEEIDGELPRRAAGSQQEFAAAAYIVAHLQNAGYRTRLDAVPVADLVRSTNVRSLTGGAPEIVVAVIYDNSVGDRPAGSSIGFLLELARAAAVADVQDVAFSALGAEHARESGGSLGSRRLAQLLVEEESRPRLVVVIGPVAAGAPLFARGSGAERVEAAGNGHAGTSVPEGGAAAADAAKILGKVADEHVVVGGDPRELGRVLLELLAELGSLR